MIAKERLDDVFDEGMDSLSVLYNPQRVSSCVEREKTLTHFEFDDALLWLERNVDHAWRRPEVEHEDRVSFGSLLGALARRFRACSLSGGRTSRSDEVGTGVARERRLGEGRVDEFVQW